MKRNLTIAFAIAFAQVHTADSLSWSSSSSRQTVARMQSTHVIKTRISALHAEEETDAEDGLIDESITQRPSNEITKLKNEMKVATEEGDMDRVMTIMGTLLALEGAYEGEAGSTDHSEGFCAD